MTTPNAARLASLSTRTLTLALERQRLISISTPSSSPLKPAAASSSSAAQIARNMTTLYDGIVQLETVQGSSKETKILRDQYNSVIDVLGEQETAEVGVQLLPPPPERPAAPFIPKVAAPPLTAYRDDPQITDQDMLLQQHHIMQDQDTHLESLSQSIGRQHHMSLQINDELEEQAGLLDAFDSDLDRTGVRLTRARRTLDKVSRGARDNCSTLTIAMLILILLLLIIIFKT